MDSDGFSVQLSGKKDSYVSQMGNNFTTSLHIKRISDAQSINSGSSGGSPGARIGHRKSSLALTPEDEPLDITNRNATGSGIVGGISVSQQDPVRVMNAMFPERDRVREALTDACVNLGMDTSTARQDDVFEICQQRLPSMIFIDSRTAKTDAENLCRALRRNLKCTQFSVIVAIVRKSQFIKEGFAIETFLDAGFNRVVVESGNANVWRREIHQLWIGIGKPLSQSGTSRALLAALQRCKDVVHVTDEYLRIQYANKAAERVLGWRCEETIGRILGEHSTEVINYLGRGRDWEGPFPLRRRAPADTLTLPCRATAVSCDNKSTTHYVFVSESGSIGNSSGGWEVARGSLHSVRRGSLDVRSVGSDGLRRASLAKLQGLPLEAPITKVISLLSTAQEGATSQTVLLIDRAMDVLRTTELYSPQVRDDHRLRTDDPVANDLIGALLSQGPTNVPSSRRSSNDSTVIRAHISRQNVKHKAPVQVRDLLDTSLNWDFDIFKLEELTKRRPLVHLGFNLMCHYNACDVLACDEKTIMNWLTVIESNYHATNTYHNSTHAADVMQAIACYMQKDQLKKFLDPLDEIAALIAAAAHDVDHPGTSSAFLCNARHSLAILYNDTTVLENHHAAFTFKLTLNDDRVNIFKNLDRETYKIARHNVIDMILATEMTKHFEHLAKFDGAGFSSKSRDEITMDRLKAALCVVSDKVSHRRLLRCDLSYCFNVRWQAVVKTIAVVSLNVKGPYDLELKEELTLCSGCEQLHPLDGALTENVNLVKRMMIKCADVSNPSRALKYCVEWTRRIAEEYFLQTDEEKKRELPVVMPVFDRATCSIPRSQIGFIDYIIISMVEAWDDFIEMPELVSLTRSNYQYWRDMDDKGITTLQDLKMVQSTLSAPILNVPKSSPE